MITFSEEQLRSLKQFNEKAEKLLNSRFAQFVIQRRRLSIEIDMKKGEGVKITKRLPDQHAIDEFVLTFRFFIQDNEKSSFRNIAKIYSDLSVSAKLKEEFSDLRKELNDYLDSYTHVKDKKGPVKRRTVLYTFVYGKLAHENPEWKKMLDYWMTIPLFPELLELDFDFILVDILGFIQHAVTINAEAMEELGRSQK